MTAHLAWFPIDKCFIDGRWVKAQIGRDAADRRPVAGDRDRRNRPRARRGRRCRGRGGRARASRRLGASHRDRARAVACKAGQSRRREGRRAGADRSDRRWQAVEAGASRRSGARPLHGVLRRRRRQGHGRDPALSRRLHRLHPARAARRDRAYRAVELSDADRRAHNRRGAGDGQRLRLEAGGGSLPHLACARRPRAGSGFPGRRAQCRSGPRRGGGRGARRPRRRHAIFPSPARSRSGRWSRRRRRAMSPR